VGADFQIAARSSAEGWCVTLIQKQGEKNDIQIRGC
jgi:hypothetical protein